MLKIRLMGMKNDIKWLEKILKRQLKVAVTEVSELYRNKGTNRYYRAYVEMVKDQYDYILIDCMPSLGMITINAFACVDSIPMSVRTAETSAEGVSTYQHDPKGRVAGAYHSFRAKNEPLIHSGNNL